MDDIKALEIIDNLTFSITLNKQYIWGVEDAQSKNEFVVTLVKLCRKYVKKQPKFKRIDENLLKGDLPVAEHQSTSPERTQMKSQLKSMVAEESTTDSKGSQLMNIDELLSDFNWKVTGDAAALEAKLVAESMDLESGQIYGLIESTERTALITAQIDRTLDELGRLENWLFLYSAQLQDMAQEVATIDVKNKGLQTQNANQKILVQEMEELLVTVAFFLFYCDYFVTFFLLWLC